MGVSSKIPNLPSRVLNAAEAWARHPQLAPRLLTALERSDDLADAVALELGDDPRGTLWQELGRALQGAPAQTASVRAVLEQARERPPFFDERALREGGRTLIKRGPLGGMLLGTALIVGYASPAGNKPLVMSGVLHKRLVRRVNETARFVDAVTQPGGMLPGAEGFGITIKVRIMHARVRQLCLQSGRWDAAAWGHPINQHDMLATILLFSSVVLLGFERFGVEASRKEAEDYLRLWSWVGHVIGVEPELLPVTLKRDLEIADIIQLTQGPPDDDSRALTHAFLEAPIKEARTDEEREKARRRLAFSHGMLRGIMGDELADQLQLKKNRYRFVVPAASRVLRGGRALQKAPGVGRLAEHFGKRYWAQAMDMVLAEGAPTFAPPERLYG